jgi:predicted phage-related endonuclease
MAVTGRRTWYIAAVILGSEFTYRKLTWDEGIISSLIEAEENFWNEYVAKGIMPPPDGSKACDEVLEKYFHTTRKAGSIELVGFDEQLKRRAEILDSISELQEEQKKIEQEIKMFMGENEFAANENYRVSWNRVDTTRLDTGRIKQERPEIYEDYVKVSSSRRFQIKVA